MMASRTELLLLLGATAVLIVITVLAVFVGRRKQRAGQVTAPVCGACGYQIAPNPSGLTVCPECGGDFLEVGILAPKMKLSRRSSPTVPLGIAWFVVVAVGMFFLHGHLLRTFTRQMSVNTVTQTSSGRGPFKGISVTAKREQLVGEQQPEVLRSDVAVTGDDGKDFAFTVDGLTKTIVEAPAASGLKGAQWDGAAAKKILAAVSGDRDDGSDESWQKLRSTVDNAMQETAGGFGGRGMFNSTMMSSSSSGFFTNRPSRGYIETSSSSKSSGGMTNVVVIGPLRGAHWVTVITCAVGLTLVLIGLALIVLLTREKRTR